MNMFQLQERIKDFSKDQLVREMQQPSGVVPPFLVLSELQRRTRMEKAFQADQAQGQQSTVAQDAINAAGVPQGGIADMAQAMAPQTDMGGNTGAMPVQNMYGGGEVKRMQPGGEVEGPNTAALRAIMEAQNTVKGMQARNRAMQAILNRANQTAGLAGIEPRVIPVMDEFSGLPPEMTEPGTLADIEPTIDISGAGAREGEGPYTEAVRSDIARQRRRLTPDDYQSRGETDPLDPRSPSYVPPFDTSGAYANLIGAPTRAEAMFGDIGPLQGPTQPEAYAPVRQGAPLSARPDILMDLVPEPDVTPFINEVATGSSVRRDTRGEAKDYTIQDWLDASEPGGRTRRDTRGESPGYTLEELAESSVSRGDVDTAERERMAAATAEEYPLPNMTPLPDMTPIIPLTPDADTPRPVPRPDRGTTPPGGGGGGTGGGAGGGARARATSSADADKWLALAQFGLGLMASQAPTLGGAIGEAGTAALSQLRESQKEAYERDLAERTLAARSAGQNRGALTANQALSDIGDQIQSVSLRLTMATTPAERVDLTNELELLQQQRANILTASGFGPATIAAAETGVDFNAEG